MGNSISSANTTSPLAAETCSGWGLPRCPDAPVWRQSLDACEFNSRLVARAQLACTQQATYVGTSPAIPRLSTIPTKSAKVIHSPLATRDSSSFQGIDLVESP